MKIEQNYKLGEKVDVVRDFFTRNPFIGQEVKIFRVIHPIEHYEDYKYDVCNKDGDCYIVSQCELTENKNVKAMKAMKDAVLKVAKDLLKANNTITTLEIKTELRRDYPYFYWTQDTVSKYMAEFAGDGMVTYTDNGTYRVYSLANAAQVAATTGPVTKSLVGKPKRRIPSSTLTIDRKDVLRYAVDTGFEEVSIYRKGGLVTYTLAEIKAQKKSPISYIYRSLNKVKGMRIGGINYLVK